MTRAVVPMANRQRRLPEAGRIRTGVKAGKGMKAIDTFRFTSTDRAALVQIAETYGGTVRPWSDPKAAEGQFEVITEANEIPVILPPDPLGGSPIYELWTGKGCERRCDGETCETVTRGPDGAEWADVPCICERAGALACKPTTHLSVLLPGLRLTGTWRLVTKSDIAADEFPAMVDLIHSLQSRGLSKGLLRLVPMRNITAGETHRFIIPRLGVDETVEALAAGMARVGALPTAEPMGELEPGAVIESEASGPFPLPDEAPTGPAAAADPDDEIVDAEIVDEDAGGGGDTVPPAPTDAPNPGEERVAKPLRQSLALRCKSEGLDTDDERHAFVRFATSGKRNGLSECSLAELRDVRDALDALTAGRIATTYTDDGTPQFEAIQAAVR